MTSTYKTLWTDDYLENFALNEFAKNPLLHYWEDCPKTGNPICFESFLASDEVEIFGDLMILKIKSFLGHFFFKDVTN